MASDVTNYTYSELEANITLPLKRLWNFVLLAYGCRENVLSEKAELSKKIELYIIIILMILMHHFEGTHEFQWLSFASHFGMYSISGYFIDRSKAIGVLMIAYPVQSLLENGELDISYILTMRSLGKKTFNFSTGLISNNSNHVVEVSVFTVENDGLPFSRSVSSPKRVSATILKDNGNPYN